jgi:hypothetical protein
MNIPSRIPPPGAGKTRQIPAATGPAPPAKTPYGQGLAQAGRNFTAEGAPAPKHPAKPILPTPPRGAREPAATGLVGPASLNQRPASPAAAVARPKPG